MLGSAGVLARYEILVRKGEGTLRLQPAAVRIDASAGQSPGPVGTQPVLGTLSSTLLPAPTRGRLNTGPGVAIYTE